MLDVGAIFGSIVDFFSGGVWAIVGGVRLLWGWGCCSLDCLLSVGCGVLGIGAPVCLGSGLWVNLTPGWR